MEKIYKEIVAEVYIPELKKSYPCMKIYWKKKSKKGNDYLESNTRILSQEIKTSERVK